MVLNLLQSIGHMLFDGDGLDESQTENNKQDDSQDDAED
jgi:hypothetical protein